MHTVFVLPFPLLRVLRLKRLQLYGLILTFGLGLVTIAVNLARFITIQLGTDWNGVYVWSMAEMSVAIMVVSIPALKTFLVDRRKSSKLRSASGTASNNYDSSYTDPRHARRQNPVSCAPTDDTGSEIELNPIWREDVIVKTKEVRVDSSPASGNAYDSGEQTWERGSCAK